MHEEIVTKFFFFGLITNLTLQIYNCLFMYYKSNFELVPKKLKIIKFWMYKFETPKFLETLERRISSLFPFIIKLYFGVLINVKGKELFFVR